MAVRRSSGPRFVGASFVPGVDRGKERHMVSAPRILGVAMVVVIFSIATPAAGAPSIERRASMAVHFIVTQQLDDGSIPALDDPIPWTADAVVAMVSTRRAPRAIARALDYLEASSDEIDSVGEIGKVVMAEVAGGRDPRDFAGRDLVAELIAIQGSDGRYGTDTSVFSHAIAILALRSADEEVGLDSAADWLVAAQCASGGWQVIGPPVFGEDERCSFGYPDIDEANADTTSLAIQALAGLGVEPEHDPFAFLDTLIDPSNGGWSYDRSDSLHSKFTSSYANTNTTGMVLQAYAAADREPPRGSRGALARLQRRLCGGRAGSFFYTWGDGDGDGSFERNGPNNLASTIAAVPGLLMAELPQAPFESTRPPPKAPAC